MDILDLINKEESIKQLDVNDTELLFIKKCLYDEISALESTSDEEFNNECRPLGFKRKDIVDELEKIPNKVLDCLNKC
mgnify:CR=1 FL=1